VHLRRRRAVAVAGRVARIKLKGKGPNLGLGSLALAPSATLRVQLRNDAAALCFGATYAEPFLAGDAGRFSDKSQ
jgi:hypothetical protein